MFRLEKDSLPFPFERSSLAEDSINYSGAIEEKAFPRNKDLRLFTFI